ncbi:MAG TPA: F0F1 ATP synthase subunit B [Candidatus Ozemobacteraceae bacterium]|nr:F0F1 ATP synthase subunit B [Candidatus Ozemobacteraceae bacterium]
MQRVRLLMSLLIISISLLGPVQLPVTAAGLAPTSTISAEASPGKPHAGGEAEAGMFDIDPRILASQVLNFLVLLYILNRFLFVPVRSILEERRKRIKESMDTAEGKNREAAEVKAQYDLKLAGVEQEGYQIRQKAITDAQAARDEILAEAKQKATSIFEKAQQDISIERRKSWLQLREEVVRLTMSAAERVVEASLDDEKHHALIRRTIEQLERESAGTTGGDK